MIDVETSLKNDFYVKVVSFDGKVSVEKRQVVYTLKWREKGYAVFKDGERCYGEGVLRRINMPGRVVYRLKYDAETKLYELLK